MLLKQLELINYKNFEAKSLAFSAKVNCFVGSNGVGKTNILDAIYYLSFAKSYFNPVASQNIKHGEDFFVINGHYLIDKKDEHIVCSLKKGHKKVIKRNAKEYERLADHIGQFPLVIISPADTDLIVSGSDTRRKFIDIIISQYDSTYLTNLISYNKVLAQRNALLKYFAANHTFDENSIAVYNDQLASYANTIHKKRKEFLIEFSPIFEARYKAISADKEEVSIQYKSQLNDKEILELFKDNILKDRVLQYTSVGVHKDDLIFKIADYPIKKFGSQGQQKSFLIALKLAQFDFIKKHTKKTPILLLDDIFDKLDEARISQLIQLVFKTDFGQLFISDTHAERTETIVKNISQSYEIFKL
jgi:DNA replication and repair protein RecF